MERLPREIVMYIAEFISPSLSQKMVQVNSMSRPAHNTHRCAAFIKSASRRKRRCRSHRCTRHTHFCHRHAIMADDNIWNLFYLCSSR